MPWWGETSKYKTNEVSTHIKQQLLLYILYSLRLFREFNTAVTKVKTPTVIKSNPVFQYAAAGENVSQLVSAKTKSREEDMKQAILELAQLGNNTITLIMIYIYHQ